METLYEYAPYAIYVILITLLVIVYLIIRIAKICNEKTLTKLSEIQSVIHYVLKDILDNEKAAVSRDNSFRSTLSKNLQKIENVITQKHDEKISNLEEKLIVEIQSSKNVIQSSIQHSHSGLSNSFKAKLSEINSELLTIRQSLQELKEDILTSQTQSFSSLEMKMSSIRNDEHRFIEKEVQSIHQEHDTLEKKSQDITMVMNNHLDSLKPLEDIFGQLNTLYNKLIQLDKDILNQENSLNGMLDKHVKLVEYTQKLQTTSKDIFDMMKLLLLESVIERTTPSK